MTTTRTLGIAIGIAFAASSFAFAQQGNPAANAAASGGPGTHQATQKTGSAANTQKVIQNQNGYGLANNGMPPATYKGPGAMQSYPVQDRSNTAANAAASGGPGTHQSTVKTGTAASNEKVIQNRSGYRGLYSSARHHRKMVRR